MTRRIFFILIIILIYILLLCIRSNQQEISLQVNLFKDFRNDLDQKIENLLPSPQAELFSGILLGEKKNLPGNFKIELRDTSTLHIVVVSGQNLTLLAGFLMNLAGIFSRRTAIVISLLAVIFYVLLTGAEIPVLRAAVMSFLSFLASILGKQKESVWILFISALLLVLLNPFWIYELSFQLSFLATFGVIVVTPILLKTLKHFPSFIASDLAVTVGAQLMVTPIIAQSFHQISLVGVITNVFVVWTIPFVMILGAVMLIFSYLFSPIAQLISFFVSALLTYFIYVVHFFASLPFAWEYVGEKSWIFWVGYYLLLSGIIWGLNRKQ